RDDGITDQPSSGGNPPTLAESGTVRRLVLLLPFSLLGFASAGAQGTAQTPTASAHALAIRITTPSGGSTSVEVSSPPNPAPAVGGGFAYPADGSVLTA